MKFMSCTKRTEDTPVMHTPTHAVRPSACTYELAVLGRGEKRRHERVEGVQRLVVQQSRVVVADIVARAMQIYLHPHKRPRISARPAPSPAGPDNMLAERYAPATEASHTTRLQLWSQAR